MSVFSHLLGMLTTGMQMVTVVWGQVFEVRCTFKIVKRCELKTSLQVPAYDVITGVS
uniref:ZP domain-containing protein n=1 Tax=Anguilla anguilla TaxID=7936 RepID=A0A0E9QXI8_ANGAN